MKPKVISCTLDPKSIDQAIKDLNDWKVNWLEDRLDKLIDILVSRGVYLAQVKFNTAVYDGDRGVEVSFEEREPGKAYAVVAVGKSAVFIEFGSGVKYPDDHPLAQKMGMIRGEYGAGKGSNAIYGWTYYGEPGINGKFVTHKKNGDVYRTWGNPANQCMYRTMQELRDDFERTARRVFQ